MAETKTGATGALTRLTAVSRALTYAVSLDEVLDITVECAADLLDAPRVLLMLRDDEGLLGVRASLGCEQEAIDGFREPLDETLIARLKDLLGPDARERFLGVPLVVRGGVIGLLAVLRSAERPQDERDEWLLSALADQASVALESAGRDTLVTRIQELEREGTQREQALRMIGHDLRNPLSALNGYLHLMEMESYGPLNDAQRSALERLQAIAIHLEAMVGSVLEMGRLAMGTLELECEPVELAPVVEAALDILRLDAAAKDLELRVDVPPDLEVMADTARLRQVLVQLLDNAVKHAPEGSPVGLSAEFAAEQREVVIRIVDRGPGIPEEDAESIFEPYRQLVVAGTPSTGMGLGLAIARALVTLMDGSLAVDPTVSEGATFVIRLRAAPA